MKRKPKINRDTIRAIWNLAQNPVAIDVEKWQHLMAEKWPEIMRQNAALGLPAYEREKYEN